MECLSASQRGRSQRRSNELGYAAFLMIQENLALFAISRRAREMQRRISFVQDAGGEERETDRERALCADTPRPKVGEGQGAEHQLWSWKSGNRGRREQSLAPGNLVLSFVTVACNCSV